MTWDSSGCDFHSCIGAVGLVMTLLLSLETGDLIKRGFGMCSSESDGPGISGRNALVSFFIKQARNNKLSVSNSGETASREMVKVSYNGGRPVVRTRIMSSSGTVASISESWKATQQTSATQDWINCVSPFFMVIKRQQRERREAKPQDW
jgi:hypothetical protein